MIFTFSLTICLGQILLIVNGMENRDDRIELFLSIRLPFSVKRDEIINVPALMYNPFHYKLHIAITLCNNDAEFEYIDFGNKVISEPKLTKSITLEDHSAATVSFLIRPKVIGNITLKFKASTSIDSDTIHKTMNVVPEGITQYKSGTFLINLKNESEYKSEYALILPEDFVPDSQHVEVGVVGDIMGIILKNLDNLVCMPTGPGEQTISSLLPNYLIMKYLKKANRLTPNVEARLRHNLETGYKNLLNYRHMDGSFGSFGPSRVEKKPPNGSTLLTAYILRFLSRFTEFINVNETVIEQGLDFLGRHQAQNGSLNDMGEYIYPSQRNPITLTGAAIVAFLENPAYVDKYLQNIFKGLEFIVKNLEKYKLLHIQALATYAANMAKDVTSRKTSLIKWLQETNFSNQKKWWHNVFLSDVENTSYNLLMLLSLNSTYIEGTLPAVTRLIVQLNNVGGFESTQNSVAGFITLINFAKFADYEPAKMDVNFVSENKNETTKLTKDNGSFYKRVELPPKTKSLKIIAKGNGSALVQIVNQYNTFKEQKDLYSSFTIKTIKIDETRPSYLRMVVCVNYVGKGESSNMVVLEFYTPSGYVIDDENLKLDKFNGVNNVELKNSGSLLVVYFDHLHKEVPYCFKVETLRTHAVTMQKPVPIIIYDSYNKDKRTVVFYNVDSKLCDICGTQEECSKCK